MKHIQNTSCDYSSLISFLQTESKRFNLTAISDYADIKVKHVEDCLHLSRYIQSSFFSIHSIIDIGTGAGFPGLVLAAENPVLSVFLLDSTKKKVEYLKQAVLLLKLTNAYPVLERIETYAAQNKNSFDIVTARALASLDVLLEYSSPLLRVGGYLLAMKSSNIQDELEACTDMLSPLGFSSPSLYAYQLQGIQRYIVSVKKISHSKISLPRRNGLATKKPLRRKV